MTGLRPFCKTNWSDAKAVIQARFSSASCDRALRYLNNPISPPGVAAGDIAYEDDRPIGFQAAILRRLYKDGSPFFGVVGGMLCMQEGSSPVLLMNLMKSSIVPRGGSVFFYANTANATSMKMNRLLGVNGRGPSTCERIRFAPTWCPRVLKMLCPEPQARRLKAVDAGLFDDFWTSYLRSSVGVVTSRSSKEVDWVLGDRLKTGRVVMLGVFSENRLVGYVAMNSNGSGRRWMIIDWIALNNCAEILTTLLKSAVQYLRKYTSAFLLESVGFPAYAEPIIKRVLPFARKAPNNTFLYRSEDKTFRIDESSWFFGPWDGDRCM